MIRTSPPARETEQNHGETGWREVVSRGAHIEGQEPEDVLD
jgi:hypothetical protein